MSDIDFFYIGGGVTELSFVASAQGGHATAQIEVPDTGEEGDLAILLDFGSVGSVNVATPTGWTEIKTSAFGGLGSTTIRSSYKLLETSDIGSAVTGITGADARHQAMVILRPDTEIEEVEFTTPNSFANASDPPDQTVSPSGQQTPGVVIGMNGSSNPNQADMASSPAFDDTQDRTGSGTASGSIRLGWKIYNASPANHTISATGTGARVLQSFYLRVS